MSQPLRGSRAVFVGNIPFEYTEEQLIDVFKEVGPVASFRLLFDRDSGRPKGYGFCEYYDAETAASAVRNLNDYEIGGRQLRVDYASMDDSHRTTPHPAPQTNQFPPQPPIQAHTPVSHPPPMQRPPPPTSSHDDINKVLSSMSSHDLLTLMRQMKQLSLERPEYAREFLSGNPQVAYALFQAMVMMNLVDPSLIARLMSSLPAPQQQQKQQPPPMMQQQMAPPPMGQSMNQPMNQPMGPPMNQPMQPPMNQPMNQPMGQPMPPMGQPMNQPLMQGNPQDSAAEQQKALLMQVLQLTEEQINNLPPEHRDQVRQLRAQLTMQQQS